VSDEPKTFDLVVLDAVEPPIYFVVRGSGMDPETASYSYDEARCPKNIFDNAETVIFESDTDPHGIFTFLRTIPCPPELRSGHGYRPDDVWRREFPEAFKPTESYLTKLHDALRRYAVRDMGGQAGSPPVWHCLECGESGLDYPQPSAERHKDGCLAAPRVP
jgi:hypothetical protein